MYDDEVQPMALKICERKPY